MRVCSSPMLSSFLLFSCFLQQFDNQCHNRQHRTDTGEDEQKHNENLPSVQAFRLPPLVVVGENLVDDTGLPFLLPLVDENKVLLPLVDENKVLLPLVDKNKVLLPLVNKNKVLHFQLLVPLVNNNEIRIFLLALVLNLSSDKSFIYGLHNKL